jgi:hypothetical protein
MPALAGSSQQVCTSARTNSAARMVLQRAIAKLYVLMLTGPLELHLVTSSAAMVLGRWVNLLLTGALMRNTCYWKQLELAYVQVVHSQIAGHL